MADKRPYAKIDVGYLLNPKWFQVERAIRSDERIDDRIDVRSLVRLAREAHLVSILYCAQNVTDGQFPVDIVKSLATVRQDEEPAITALFTVGLWENETGGTARVRHYLEHQTSAAKIKQLSEAGKAGAAAREAKKNEPINESIRERRTNRSTEEKRREEKLIQDDFASWYKHYPKKVGKGDALKAFKTARKKTDLDTLIAATKKYAAAVKDSEPRFIKNPGPWLRDERWLDDLSASAVPSYDPWEANRV